ncbi:hypothetical protein [Ramlibacter sp.]|uniref:hypothetical protein n=1 Tax=Ramlibacter sp. TaxID=1917967 RepID=UPI002B688282|nr:hypothetical protein [Ramlibacter sp.]HWI83785.1 hypothetical protein [Ramlibacter sp.]
MNHPIEWIAAALFALAPSCAAMAAARRSMLGLCAAPLAPTAAAMLAPACRSAGRSYNPGTAKELR